MMLNQSLLSNSTTSLPFSTGLVDSATRAAKPAGAARLVQMHFDWATETPAAEPAVSDDSQSTAIHTEALDSPSRSSRVGVPEIKIRRMRRIGIPGEPPRQRQISPSPIGGEVWESPESEQNGVKSPCTEAMAGRDSQRSQRSQASQCHEHQATQLRDNSQRLGKPVKIGATMLQLLRRYGITEAEIAQGIAAYAQKHCSSCAS